MTQNLIINGTNIFNESISIKLITIEGLNEEVVMYLEIMINKSYLNKIESMS